MTSKLITCIILYMVIFIVAEILYRRGCPVKITRKIVHIGAGIISFFLPLLVNLQTTISIGILFAFLLFWTKKRQLLNSIHKNGSENFGPIFFPVGLALCAIVFWNINPIIFQGSSLILGLSDGLAGLFGQRFGKIRYNFTGDKTLEGSLVFFLVAFVILLSILTFHKNTVGFGKISFVLLGALILSIIEGVSGKGWDNLFIPVSGGIVLYLIIM
ncbi:MAG: hypothetical protein AAB110_04240 [Candidatus Desantisbacteria bacterium]